MANNLYNSILIEKENKVTKVILNRPDVHNAFNDVMINELLEVFNSIKKDTKTRVIVITGSGKSFCAGADLSWMKKIVNYSYEENLKESLELAELFYTINSSAQPTIARVNGAVIAGGTGLISVCDIVIAVETAKFSLSEVKLGLVPACISPYVLKRIGEKACRELFLTGERIDAYKAKEYGLVNYVVKEADLDKEVNEFVNLLLSSGPNAIAICKELIQKIPSMNPNEYKKYTAEIIAKLRISDEGQEGMNAFLEKRKPKWGV